MRKYVIAPIYRRKHDLNNEFQNILQKEGDTMSKVGELFQSADWKSEKHVPVIECPDQVTADEVFEVKVTLGKEVAHPNTTAHHIRWIQLYFKPEGDKFCYQVGNFEFTAHGEAVDGADKGPVYTHHSVTASMKTKKPGALYATSLCNIHGLWENTKQLKVK
jgi:superoxide reductase